MVAFVEGLDFWGGCLPLMSHGTPPKVPLDVERAGYWSQRLMSLQGRVGGLDLGVDDPRGPIERGEGEGLEFVPGEALRDPWGALDRVPVTGSW